MKKKAFTLVELIVVITILTILATIAFVSVQNYTVYARDGVRLSSLRTLETGLKIQYTQGGKYLVPDQKVDITASGTVIRNQGVFGKNVTNSIRANQDGSKDPQTEQYYDYITNPGLSEYQLITYLEGETGFNNSLVSESYAVTDGLFKSMGQELGMVSSGAVNLHRITSNIGQSFDIVNNDGVEYRIQFDTNDEIASATGGLLFSNMYNRSKNLLRNKKIATLDTSLVGYWDMETFTSSDKLKDISKNENHGAVPSEIISVEALVGNGLLFPNDSTSLFDIATDNTNPIDIGTSDFTVYSLSQSHDYEWPDSDFIIHKSTGCYNGAANEGPGFEIGHGYSDTSINICLMDNNGNRAHRNIDFIQSSLNDVGQWKTYAFVFSRSQGKVFVYVNGVLQDDFLDISHVTGDISSSDSLGFGGLHGWKTDGLYDELRIYNRELKQLEIQKLYGIQFNSNVGN